MQVCAIIPSRNHVKALPAIIVHLRLQSMPVFLIDDGNEAPVRRVLESIVKSVDGVTLHRLEPNQGKGAAVMAGMRLAKAAGFTHAFQIDADGQHDLSVVPSFLQAAARYPEALICGRPVYDASAPLGRKIARWLTHVWVWIETRSFRIADSMCGFRLYPLESTVKLIDEEKIGRRMDFDTDIIVRLFWRGVAPLMMPVRVSYPKDNVSNFDLVRDNLRITLMHTRLVLTMMLRVAAQRLQRPPLLDQRTHWARLSERGVYGGMKLCAGATRVLGPRGRRLMLLPIVGYFYLTGGVQRTASAAFLSVVLGRAPTARERFRPFMNFGLRSLDVFMAWAGRLPKDSVQAADPEALQAFHDDPRGGVIVVAHMGAVEVMCALLDPQTRARLTILVHTHHAAQFNRLIHEDVADVGATFLQVTEIGPETLFVLKERIEKGGWVVIAGDRTPVHGKDHIVTVPFFGHDAAFPQGPWILAGLLACPVTLMFCMNKDGVYRLSVEPFADRLVLPREGRTQAVRSYAASYAQRLEAVCAEDPFQWYNFYDFWSLK